MTGALAHLHFFPEGDALSTPGFLRIYRRIHTLAVTAAGWALQSEPEIVRVVVGTDSQTLSARSAKPL